MKEIWKNVKGYNGKYQISNIGRVKSLKGKVPIFLKTTAHSKGYLMVGLCGGIKPRTFTIHRLVAKAFIGIRPNGWGVNHKDGNKKNNCVSNLEWMTNIENIKHAIKNNLHNSAMLTKKQVLDIRKKAKSGVRMKDLLKIYKISRSAIKECVYFKSWRWI